MCSVTNQIQIVEPIIDFKATVQHLLGKKIKDLPFTSSTYKGTLWQPKEKGCLPSVHRGMTAGPSGKTEAPIPQPL